MTENQHARNRRSKLDSFIKTWTPPNPPGAQNPEHIGKVQIHPIHDGKKQRRKHPAAKPELPSRPQQPTPGAAWCHALGAALVEVIGVEPTTSCLQSRRSPN